MSNDGLLLIAANVPNHHISSELCGNSMSVSLSERAENVGGLNANGLVSCSLKRKRPPKIEIPNVLREISTDIFSKGSAAQTQRQGDGAVSFTDSGVGVFSTKGKKKFMEDYHKIYSCSNDNKGFFGVYDGHGGSKAAEFVAQNLHLNIFEMLENSSENKAKEEAVKAGYLKTDEEFLKQGLGSGACCVTALVEGNEMIVSNLGDCRAVLCRDGIAEALTVDHRPTQEDERKRIEDKGGYVEFHRGTWRVHGTLAVSRSIGDAHLKNWVIAEPDMKVIPLTPDMEYLVLATDGLWDEVSNQEVIDVVLRSCSGGKKQPLRSPGMISTPYPCQSSSPFSKSPRISLVKSKRIIHPIGHKTSNVQQKRSEDELCDENESPPSKSRRISLVKQVKTKTHYLNNENEGVEKQANNSGLLNACKELVDLAVKRGSLDDITVMIVDLNHYRG